MLNGYIYTFYPQKLIKKIIKVIEVLYIIDSIYLWLQILILDAIGHDYISKFLIN